MTHTLPSEDWPDGRRPALGRLLLQRARRPARPAGGSAGAPSATPRAFLRGAVARYWPGFRLRPGRIALRARERRPVRSLRPVAAGHGRARLRADASGYDNLFLAGDWIDCGLNAGCVEAAVLAGLQAANAVRGRPLMDGVLGTWSRA